MCIRHVCAVQIMFCNKIYLLVGWIFLNATFKQVIPIPMLCHPHTAHFSKPASYTAKGLYTQYLV